MSVTCASVCWIHVDVDLKTFKFVEKIAGGNIKKCLINQKLLETSAVVFSQKKWKQVDIVYTSQVYLCRRVSSH